MTAVSSGCYDRPPMPSQRLLAFSALPACRPPPSLNMKSSFGSDFRGQ